MYNIQVLEIIMNIILTLLSLLMFIISAILFSTMTLVYDFNYGSAQDFIQLLLWFAMGLSMVSFGFATVVLNNRN